MTEHDRVRMERALNCDRTDVESVRDAVRGLQSTDDPSLLPLHDELMDVLLSLETATPPGPWFVAVGESALCTVRMSRTGDLVQVAGKPYVNLRMLRDELKNDDEDGVDNILVASALRAVARAVARLQKRNDSP